MGAGCFSTPSPTTADGLPVVEIPADFPSDILRYPGALTYAANIQNEIPTLGQVTASSSQEVITWINQAYPAAKKDLHLFNDQGSIKLYSFQNQEFRYNVRLELVADPSRVKIVTQKVTINSVEFE